MAVLITGILLILGSILIIARLLSREGRRVPHFVLAGFGAEMTAVFLVAGFTFGIALVAAGMMHQ